jgi:hypothetical protein
MSKKVSAISIALLVFAGSIVGVPSASAATPYKACKPAKAKATIGKISYTCAANPAKTSKALVWVSKQCTTAGVNYRDIVEQTDVISKLFQSAITTAERAITNLPKKEKTMTDQAKVAQGYLDKYLAANPNVMTTGTEAQKKSVAETMAGIAKIKENIASLPSIKTENEKTISDSQIGLAKNTAEVVGVKAQLVKACK